MNSALFISAEAPYPLAGGGAMRSASLLNFLTRRYAVDMIVFHDPSAPDPRMHLPPGLVRRLHVVELPAHARHPLARAARNAGRLARRVPPLMDRFAGFGSQIAAAMRGQHYEIAVIEHFWCAPYWNQAAAVSDATILDLHNIESIWHARCAQAAKGPQACRRIVSFKTSAAIWRRNGCRDSPVCWRLPNPMRNCCARSRPRRIYRSTGIRSR